MEFIQINRGYFQELRALHMAYKADIGEEAPVMSEISCLEEAIEQGRILFFGCAVDDSLVAVCSVCKIFTTYNYKTGGIFEDFYIMPEYRHKGIARKLVEYAVSQSQVTSLIVGCADCDVDMYKAIGFSTSLGNMLSLNI